MRSGPPPIRPLHPNPSPKTRRTRGNVWRPSTYHMYFVPPRLPHPCPRSCHLLPCPALPCPASLCCLPSDTRNQHVDDSYIILGLPPRSDSRSPDGGYNNSKTSQASFQALSSSTAVFSSVSRYHTYHCSPVVTAHPTSNTHTNRRHPSPAHLHINKATIINRHTGCTHLHAQPTPPRRNQLWFQKGVYQGHRHP